MTLNEEEKKICDYYGQRFADGKVGCSRCPLAIDTRWCICKANCTEEEWAERKECYNICTDSCSSEKSAK